MKNITIAVWAVAFSAIVAVGCAVGSDTLGTGGGNAEQYAEAEQEIVAAKRAGGIWAHPESCAWHPLLGRFLCTNAVIGSPAVSFHDNVGWIGQVSKTGQALWPLDGGGVGPGTPPGWGDITNTWYDQWGANELGNPLGLAVNPANGNIYVAEGGKLDFGSGPQPSICVYNQSGVFQHRIMMPGVLTINDLAWYGNALYVTDSAFSSPNLSAIWKVLQPDNAAATPQSWLSLANYPRPNAMVFRMFDAGTGLKPHLFVSTLGTNLDPEAAAHNGGVIRIDIGPRAVTGLGIFDLFSDGIAWQRTQIGPGRLLVSDLRSRRIFTVNPLTGASALWQDVSTTVDQLAGMGCDESVPSVCAAATLRGEVLILSQ